jgi:membrane protein YdbS with pleckstrin-like domain
VSCRMRVDVGSRSVAECANAEPVTSWQRCWLLVLLVLLLQGVCCLGAACVSLSGAWRRERSAAAVVVVVVVVAKLSIGIQLRRFPTKHPREERAV